MLGIKEIFVEDLREELYASDSVTFEDDAGSYDQKDAEGFIKLNALRLRILAKRR